jgi:hypothetical protein
MDPPPQSSGISPAKPPVVNLPFFNVSTQPCFEKKKKSKFLSPSGDKAGIQISKILDSNALDPTEPLLAFIAVLILSRVVRSNTLRNSWALR